MSPESVGRTAAFAAGLVCAASASLARGDEAEGKAFIDVTAADVLEQCEPNCAQVEVERSADPAGLTAKIAAGKEGYPGVFLKPAKGMWDLSEYGHVEARVTNTSDHKISVSLRIDNSGHWRDAPWNTESTGIEPGKTQTVKVIFGYQYGRKKGFPLDPSKVKQLLIFTFKAKKDTSFRIESVVAAGPAGEKPPVKPQDVRIKPEGGFLLGGGVKVKAPDRQIKAGDGATAKAVTQEGAQKLHVTCPAGKEQHTVEFRPPIGRWDLTMACDVRVRVTNVGNAPVTPGVCAASGKWNKTGTTFAETPLRPGESREIVRLFEADSSWRGKSSGEIGLHDKGVKGTGTNFASDKAEAVHLIVKHEGAAELRVDAIRATATPVETPDWLGKRPPVEGKWALKFEDNFGADAIDRDAWQIYTANYWDKRTHFSKDNLVMGDGKVRLRMEKKRGYVNDDPDQKQPKTGENETDYACGHLETYDKFAQRYGYFEARMKLPTAPGLWPAFWMMPDRGNKDWPRWKRSMTEEGGMEFDIMEHLTRWGPYRYNIAMHWDGYGKGHKSTGSSSIYVQPDAEGFITCGLLWGPGEAVFYCNGKEVGRWENQRVCSVPMYPILYMVTGGWDNSPLDDDRLPADFVIEYVRVWQREDWKPKEK